MGSYGEEKREGGNNSITLNIVCEDIQGYAFWEWEEMRNYLLHLTRKLREIENYRGEKKLDTLLLHNGSCFFS